MTWVQDEDLFTSTKADLLDCILNHVSGIFLNIQTAKLGISGNDLNFTQDPGFRNNTLLYSFLEKALICFPLGLHVKGPGSFDAK